MRKFSTAIIDSGFSGLLLGAAFFFAVFGSRILDPSYIDWLMEGDSATHFLGWHFFRHEPWTFPLGRIALYGVPDGTSLVYTDSIPIVALILKMFRNSLTEPFQYFGFWILSCYLLQGFWGWRLAAQISEKAPERWIISGFFILSPILLFRIHHESLMGQWMILAALDLCLRSIERMKTRPGTMPYVGGWTLLLFLASMVHLYLLAMTAVLYLSACGSFHLSGDTRGGWKKIRMALPFLPVIPAMIETGCFVIPPGHWSGEEAFAFYSMNLLAPFDPMGYSRFLPSLPLNSSGQYEGFAYFGLGVLALALTSMVVIARENKPFASRIPAKEWRHRAGPLLVAAVLLTLFALSTKIALGNQTLLLSHLPHAVNKMVTIFRASGRFFWAPYYLLLFAVLWFLKDRFAGKSFVYTFLLAGAFLIQMTDLSPFLRRISDTYRTKITYPNPLRSTFWADALREHRTLLYVPQDDLSHYVPFGLLAAPRHVGVNIAYKARFDRRVYDESRKAALEEIESGRLRWDALYVFKNPGFCGKLRTRDVALRFVDGFWVAYRLKPPG